MKAVGYLKSLPITEPDSLCDIELPRPTASGHDLLVKVEAVSVNPVDTKIRLRAEAQDGQHKVLGWDASGVVEAIGDDVTGFTVGDKVWYAGAIDRQGSNMQSHLIDERIVSKMPTSLSFTEAAALPLTAITAWEILFDRFEFSSTSTGHILVIGAAGGVGSILIQLAKQLTGLTVIATASRQSTADWVRSLGADHVVNHNQDIQAQLKQLGVDSVGYVASLTHTDAHLPTIQEVIAPQGALCLIDDPASLDILPFKIKSVRILWELMFTRSLFQTADMYKQGELLSQVARMVDAGELRSTLSESFGSINATNLKRAHALLESGKSVGKIVLSGFKG
ncbi:MAG: zinc-binding alcohol dehydrogenase family protein [Verrucomicrobiota bacterium]